MIYTSCFAKLKSLPDNIVPISICGKSPDWYKGLQYKKLAPKYDFFMKWKETRDNDYYIRCFNEQVLSATSFYDTFHELQEMARKVNPDAKYICLICYEKPGDFCHRHLVAEWFRANDIPCKEFDVTEVLK
jgi:hypothetical protein